MLCVVVKRCRDCGEEKPPSEYHVNHKGKDGLHSYCKPCAIARSKMYRERMMNDPYTAKLVRRRSAKYQKRTQDAEKKRVWQQRWYEKMKKDPVRYEAHVQRGRMNYRLRKEREGMVPRSGGERIHFPERRLSVPADGVLRWLDVRVSVLGITTAQLATIAGVDDAIMGHARKSGHITYDVADRLVTAAGGAVSLVAPEVF